MVVHSDIIIIYFAYIISCGVVYFDFIHLFFFFSFSLLFKLEADTNYSEILCRRVRGCQGSAFMRRAKKKKKVWGGGEEPDP